MPYLEGRRVTMDEWQAANGSSLKQFHTGPNGENPADAPELDEVTKAPKSERKAGSRRSSRTTAKVKKAIEDATGQELPDITGLDASSDEDTAPAETEAATE